MVSAKVILSKMTQRIKLHNQGLRQTLGQEKLHSSRESKLSEQIKNRKNQLRSSAQKFEQRFTWLSVTVWLGKSLVRRWVKSKKPF